MPLFSSAAAREKPDDREEDVSWAFRLMARWLGDPAETEDGTRVSLSAAEKILRSRLP